MGAAISHQLSPRRSLAQRAREPLASRTSDSRPALRACCARVFGTALLLASLVGAAPTARADDHDPKRAAHPVRIVAYALHPIGVVLDYLIVRPAHWVVEREPFRTLFGHQD